VGDAAIQMHFMASKTLELSTQALDKALAQRDRLLEYDKNSEKRTTVIDDELDYFQVGLLLFKTIFEIITYSKKISLLQL